MPCSRPAWSALGEWFRRTERALPVDAIPAAHVPSILTAAGTASAFGTAYAAHALYGFIGPAAAFVLLGAIGIATMVAAALHGPALAGLGLAGSLVVPMLVTSNAPSPWPLVVYLAVVAAAAFALARLRRWLWLAAAVVAGAVVWGVALLGQVGLATGGWASALFVHVAVQMALAAAFIALEPHLATRDEDASPDWIATIALAALSMLAVLALGGGRFDAQWGAFAVVCMAILALTAWRSAPGGSRGPARRHRSLGGIRAWPGLPAPPARGCWRLRCRGVAHPRKRIELPDVCRGLDAAIAALATLRLGAGERCRCRPPASTRSPASSPAARPRCSPTCA